MASRISIAQNWLEDAKWAASGANAQPWAVDYEEASDQIAFRLSIDPKYRAHKSLMDPLGTATVLALGCLATNLVFRACLDGYGLSSETFSLGEDLWAGSVLLIFDRDPKCEKVFSRDDILNRRTDRYPYFRKPVPESVRNSILEICQKYPGLTCSEFSSNKEKLLPGLAVLETIRWTSRRYFQSFIAEIGFGPKSEQLLDKIPVTRLGIAKPDQWLLWSLWKWPALYGLVRRWIHFIAVRKSIHGFVKNCDRIFFVQAKANDFETCYEFGKCFQEVWLKAQKEGISFQPLGVPLVALGYWLKDNQDALENAQVMAVEKVTEQFAGQFGLDLKKLLVGFRIGLPRGHAQKSPRKALQARGVQGLLQRARSF